MHSLYFGVPWDYDCHTIKNRKRVNSATPKYGDILETQEQRLYAPFKVSTFTVLQLGLICIF